MFHPDWFSALSLAALLILLPILPGSDGFISPQFQQVRLGIFLLALRGPRDF
jgi:hypothetical protein